MQKRQNIYFFFGLLPRLKRFAELYFRKGDGIPAEKSRPSIRGFYSVLDVRSGKR